MERFDSNVALGTALGHKSGATVGQWLSGHRNIREDSVVKIESLPGLKGWFSVNPRTEYAGRARSFRKIPVVGTAKLGEDGFYEEFSSAVGSGDGHVEIQSEDPNAYALRVRGQSMFPSIRDGWYVLVEPNMEPSPGEYVLIRLRDGRKMVKELLFRRGRTVEVMSVNGDHRLSFDVSDFEEERGIQAVGAILPPGKWRPD